MMSRPDDSLVGGSGPENGPPASTQDVVVKCPSCRETTKAASLNSLRKNYQLIDMLKMHRSVTSYLMNTKIRDNSSDNMNKENTDTVINEASSEKALTLADLSLKCSQIADEEENPIRNAC